MENTKNFITILDDDTFSDLRGSHVLVLTSSQRDKLLRGAAVSEIEHAGRYDLNNPAHLRHLAFLLEVESHKRQNDRVAIISGPSEADGIIHGC